ncbi:MAG: glucosaminidase domain-containing protein [Mariprofundaceae bacterium]
MILISTVRKQFVTPASTLLLMLAFALISGCASKKSLYPTQKKEVQTKAPNQDVTEKKRRFFDFMRPVIVAENNAVMKQRKKVQKLQARHDAGHKLSRRDQVWLRDLASAYSLKQNDFSSDNFWRGLLMRVDTVPVELALAQAANESSWGRSRFAREGNNYFGQWCYSKGCGLVPRERKEGAGHEVAAYASANESVRNYIHNLNTTRAYSKLRQLRFNARQAGKQASAISLANGLDKYSSRGKAYVQDIQSMIRTNRDLMTS